jgi:hypothetical protein
MPHSPPKRVAFMPLALYTALTVFYVFLFCGQVEMRPSQTEAALVYFEGAD